MANRTMQQKLLKLKRRGRYAKFSGATSKFYPKRGENGEVYVGEISLTKQTISTGRGPNAERMQEYYARLNSYDQSIPETLGLTEPMRELKAKYDQIIRETPKEMRIRLVDDTLGSLDLFCAINQFFFVEVDKQKHRIRRSRVYSNKKIAFAMLDAKLITWVEQLPKVLPAAKP